MVGCASAKEAAEQRNEGGADQGDTATGHELLDTLGLRAGVIVAVAFHEVDNAPHAKTSSDCDYKGLQNCDCTLKKCHMCYTIHYL